MQLRNMHVHMMHARMHARTRAHTRAHTHARMHATSHAHKISHYMLYTSMHVQHMFHVHSTSNVAPQMVTASE